jgi:PAS domain S-box-containing protein
MESRDCKIMIVEDEGLIAADLQGRLERAGYTVPAIADSAGEALKAIRETSPDLVLMDIRIKGDIDGIEVAEKVRREFDVPVVYLTAYEDRGTLERASQTQAFGYIKKPIASASLQGSIEMAISKHKHERYLREQRNWFSSSFAAVPHAVIVTDGNGRTSYINPVAEELTGWKVDDALNLPSTKVLQLFDQHDRAVEDFVPVAMLQSHTTPLPDGLCLHDRAGRRYAIQGSIAPKYRDGRVDGTVIAFKDVTLACFEEKQSRQDDKQGALLRMADGIARHLDLELGVVAEESSRLLDSLSLDSGLRDTAETIERAALDAFAVSGRLQAFARQPDLHMRPVRINEVLARLEHAWKRLLPTFTLVPDPDPRPVQADPWQMTRVLVTVLLHARNSMQTGAAVELSVSRPEIDAMREWIRIRVTYKTQDEDAAALEHAFEPSWSSDSEGLPLAYRRVREMGGLFTTRIEQDKKVDFEIFLPQVQVEAAGATISELPQPAILLVEPNPEVRRVLHSHFARNGFNLLETESCEEALLLAHLYEGLIPLAIAHPAKGDWARAELATKLSAIKPGISTRLLAGYFEDCGTPGSAAWEATCRYLTKWDLLEWANRAILNARGANAAD